MTGPEKLNRRDEVLFAFHEACDAPSPEDIIAWAEKYPEYADDIRAHGAIRRDWAAQAVHPERKASWLRPGEAQGERRRSWRCLPSASHCDPAEDWPTGAVRDHRADARLAGVMAAATRAALG